MSNESKHGPGYATPLDAMNGPKEELLYVVCIQPDLENKKGDFLATVDVNPTSPTFCKIIHRLYTNSPKDELHHSGWNACSSCYNTKGCCKAAIRDKLILPALGSDNIYVIETGKNPRQPTLHKMIKAEEMYKFNCATPHTTHCLPNGEVMISVLGDVDGNGKGDFILLDGKDFTVKGTWTNGKKAKFGYDFWYQPYYDIMVSSEWGAPKIFKKGFQSTDVTEQYYGHCLNLFSWKKRELIQTIDLGLEGTAPLEVRFLHNPKEKQGYVGCALYGNVFTFYLNNEKKWVVEKVIDIPAKKVNGWFGDTLSSMITDILISLDDKYLYLSNWFHGDVRQYDISDRKNPRLTGQVFLGGKLLEDSSVKVVEDPECKTPVKPVIIQGKRLHGSPQMLQLSLDGKRLYVSSSLFSPWDKQFYPETTKNGSFLVKLDIDTENGGMKLDQNFLVDFGEGPDGPVFAHEMRYPGGDCTSDIWLVD